MELAAYLDRIRFKGPVRPDLITLKALHRAHQYAVPFENLDVQLGRPVALDIESCYSKIVTRRRGGWCYEMNGVMGWALREIGFDVTRLSGGVRREQMGDGQLGTHLCLRVQLDQPYLVDVGFGGSLAEPMPLLAAEREDSPYCLGLSRTDDGFWRFSEKTHDTAPFSFDFSLGVADEALFASKCRSLQVDPASPFVQSLVAQRRLVDTHISLRGRVLRTTHSSHVDQVLLESAAELVDTLLNRFDLDVPESATLWPAVCARHEAIFSGHS
ncbi:MAG: arylamine N-acetyltransferase [Gammaproteobacteria bacterium]